MNCGIKISEQCVIKVLKLPYVTGPLECHRYITQQALNMWDNEFNAHSTQYGLFSTYMFRRFDFWFTPLYMKSNKPVNRNNISGSRMAITDREGSCTNTTQHKHNTNTTDNPKGILTKANRKN
jgi:hypothetical protein